MVLTYSIGTYVISSIILLYNVLMPFYLLYWFYNWKIYALKHRTNVFLLFYDCNIVILARISLRIKNKNIITLCNTSNIAMVDGRYS